jgi:DNA-binding PucR family transcriptional regulator
MRPGLGLGQLLLALDATMVGLVEAPRGLDTTVASAALIDTDDVRLGLARAAGSADVFLLLGLSDDDAVAWLQRQATDRAPVAVFTKEPSVRLITEAEAAGTAVVAVDPRARWERLYQLIFHVFEHHVDHADPLRHSGTDLFGLAQSIAERIHGMVSIEDEGSHVLAYSASNADADELRRLSILGRAGPPEHLEWIGQWGIFDALRSSDEVVRVAERPELGLRPRLAVGIRRPNADSRRAPQFAGTIWVQQGSRALAEDAEDILRGAAVLAARIMGRLAAAPSQHTVQVQELLGLRDSEAGDPAALARDLGIVDDGRAALIGFDATAATPRLAEVLALSASAFRTDAQVAAHGSRVYVLFPSTTRVASVTSWIRGTLTALHNELGLRLWAVIAAPVAGLSAVATARAEVDRVLDSAKRHPGMLGTVTSLAEARTTVLLDEMVTFLLANDHLIDPRVQLLRDTDPALAHTLRAYLDSFGDVAAAAQQLHVHPNTVRYRVRRIEDVLTTSLSDPDVRLVLSLSLRAVG